MATTPSTILLTAEDIEIDPNDITDVPQWSSCEFTNTPVSNPLVLWGYQKGDDVPGAPGTSGTGRPATLCDTNRLDKGVMHDSEGMRVVALGIEFFSVGLYSDADADQGYAVDRPGISMLDLKRIHCETVFELNVLKTAVTRLPTGHFPTGPQIVITTASGRRQEGPVAGVDGFAYGVNGVPTMDGLHIFAVAHKINPTEEFEGRLSFPSGTVDGLSRRVLARATLYGPIRRAAV